MTLSAATQLAKSNLRKEIKLKISNIPSTIRQEKSNKICKKLMESEIWLSCNRVSIYISTATEVQTLPLFLSAFLKGLQVYVPRYSGPVMEMVKLRDMADLNSLPMNKWGILQPLMTDTSREVLLPTDSIDLIIVPGLAFTESGKRLGKGRGYYDKFLYNYVQNDAKKPNFIALAFKEQIIADIPTTMQDILVDKLISD